MPLNDLPRPISRFLEATAQKDRQALLATFEDDAIIVDMGKEHSGEDIARWNDAFYLGAGVRVHPLHVEFLGGDGVLTVAVDGDYAALGVTGPFQLECRFALAGDRIARLSMVERKLALPTAAVGFVHAMNMHDLEGMMFRLAPEAIVNDQMRQFVGSGDIRPWLAREIVGDRVTMFVKETWHYPAGVAVLADVTGDYDKTGLPDPLQLRFYFAIAGDLIVQLVIVPASRGN